MLGNSLYSEAELIQGSGVPWGWGGGNGQEEGG